MSHATLLAFLLVGLAATSLACSEEPTSTAATTGPNAISTHPSYDVPFRTDTELESVLGQVCEAAVARQRPLLLEFSAAWCGDCRKLGEMKTDDALAQELAYWPKLIVNVGRFDRHRDLMAELDVESIAHWAVLAPTHCKAPVGSWPRRAQRTLEVSSGEARHLSPSDLAAWLKGLRRA